MLSAGSRWVKMGKEKRVARAFLPASVDARNQHAHLGVQRQRTLGPRGEYKMALYSLLGAKRAELWRLASCDAAALRLRQPSRSQAAAQGRRPPRRSRSCASQRKAMPPRGSCWLGVRRGGLPADLQAGSAPRESMLPDRRCTRTEPALRR